MLRRIPCRRPSQFRPARLKNRFTLPPPLLGPNETECWLRGSGTTKTNPKRTYYHILCEIDVRPPSRSFSA